MSCHIDNFIKKIIFQNLIRKISNNRVNYLNTISERVSPDLYVHKAK